MTDSSTNSSEMLQTEPDGGDIAANGAISVAQQLLDTYCWGDAGWKADPLKQEYFRLSANIAKDLGIKGSLKPNIGTALVQLGAVRSVGDNGKPSGRKQTNPDNPTGNTARGQGFFVPPRVALSEQALVLEDEPAITTEPESASKPKRKSKRKGIKLKGELGNAPSEPRVDPSVEVGEDGQPLEHETGAFVGKPEAVTFALDFGGGDGDTGVAVSEQALVLEEQATEAEPEVATSPVDSGDTADETEPEADETAEATTAPPETPKAEAFPEFGSMDKSRVVRSVVRLDAVTRPAYLPKCEPAIGATSPMLHSLGCSETLVAAASYAAMGLRSLPWIAGYKVTNADKTQTFVAMRDDHDTVPEGATRTKKPLIDEWQKKATTDQAQHIRWFDDGEFFGTAHDKYYRNANIGIATGETTAGYDLAVLDVDVKNGKDGRLVLAKLTEELGSLPATLEAQTPSGGRHYLFRAPKGSGIGSRADVFKRHGDGLDIRADGGFIGVAPSAIPGVGVYRWVNDNGVAWLPESWVNALQAEHGKDTARSSKVVPAIDFESNPEPLTAQQIEDVQEVIGSYSRGIKPTVDVDGNQSWFDIGASLKRYGQPGYELWRDASRQSKHWDEAECADTWERFDGSKSIGSIFDMTDVNPATRRKQDAEAKEQDSRAQQAAVSLSAATGANMAEKPAYLPKSLPNAEPLPSLEELRTRVNTDGAKAWNAYEDAGFNITDGGKWLAWGLLHGDEHKALTYQKEHPTVNDPATGESTPRKLAPNGVVNWEIYTYVAAMHIAGVVLLMMDKPPGFALKDLGATTQEAVTRLVRDLMDSSPVAVVWKQLNASDPKKILWNKIREGAANAKVKGKPSPKVVQVVDTPPVPAEAIPARIQPKETPVPTPAEVSPTVTPEPTVDAADVVEVSDADSKETAVDRLYRLAKKAFRRQWVFDPKANAIYAPNGTGAYSLLDNTAVEGEITRLKDTYNVSIHGKGDIQSARYLLGLHLDKVEWAKARHLLPFRNTVLDLDTGIKEAYELLPKFNWQLPYDYQPGADCPTFKAFVHKAVGHDVGVVKTLQAFMRCVVGGAYQVKKYLELVGTGDSGKTQFMKLCIALVGAGNIVTSDLQSLEGSSTARFETRGFYGKRLGVLPDQDKFFGSSRVFRNLTGGDPVRYEGKGVDKGADFVFEGLLLVTANQFMNPKNAGSAIMKRRIPVHFPNAATEEEITKYLPYGGIADYIAQHEMPGVMNWVLDMPLNEAMAVMRNPDTTTKALNEKVERGNDVVLSWLTEHATVCTRGDETPVGRDVAKVAPAFGISTGRPNPDAGLYADFCDYCRGVGQSPTNRKNFVENIVAVCKQRNIFVEYTKEERRNENYNQRILTGIKLRGKDDAEFLS